ncbi:hypothetical protein J8L70_07540 [Pseudoalteromonas sp. MMG010]|uniref:hypothetical protein n=1 Tax=Pseudoalteromonas sp. MMG010 TaxID=2822685 RepID=UPI001B3A7986|nr:hypothetical protein [Pseudoalteromonas sp. MMG010]MBQ4833089.1 hypothetical protein [Pseudoalteromonas sp. MMG010]
MKITNKLLFSFLCFVCSTPVAAENSSPSIEYRTLQLQFSQWLKHAEDKQPIQGFKEQVTRTLIADSSVVSGGEFKLQTKNKQCVSFAPHRFFDKLTYKIASSLFNSQCNVLIANTLHRKKTDNNNLKIDLASYQNSAANAFLMAYSKTVEHFFIYQIHGFDANKRKTHAAKNADVILSQGIKAPSRTLQAVANCLNSDLNLNSLLYPNQVKELGATKNILNIVAPTNSTFFHIELSYSLRKRLTSEPNFMSKFSQCVTLS